MDVDEDGGQGPAFILEGEGDGDVGAIYPLGDGVGTGEGGALGLPPLMPGSGGWITADNVGDFFDEGGNWRGREGGGVGEGGEGIGLGVGAGRVRSRVEDGDGDGDGGDGEGEGMEETKWRRTD